MIRVLRFLGRASKALPSITLHPFFLAYLSVLFFCGKGDVSVIVISVVILHEVGHFLTARKFGVELGDVVMYPFGAVMVDESEPGKDDWKVALAGPIVNLIVGAGCTVCSIWSKSPFLAEFANANFTVALFNLLPAYPLDGAKAIISVSKKVSRATKFLRISGVIISFLATGLFVVGVVFGKVNLSLGVLGVFLLIGAVSGIEKEMSARVASVLLSREKDYKKGVPVVRVACDENMPVHRVLSKLSQSRLTEIEIIYRDKPKRRIDEEEFLRFVERVTPKTRIGDI